MTKINTTLIASAVVSVGLVFSAGVSAQPPKWLADEGPFQIIGDIVVNNTGKQSTPLPGTAANFGCKVHMHATGTGDGDFTIDHVQILGNGWAEPFSAFCHLVTTSVNGTSTLPWSGSVDEVSPGEFEVTISDLFFNAPGQPGCGIDDNGDYFPGSTLTGQWRQSWTASHDPTFGSFLRSAYTTIYFGSLESPPTEIVDGATNDEYCLIGGVLNVTRPTGPLVCPEAESGICEQDDIR